MEEYIVGVSTRITKDQLYILNDIMILDSTETPSKT